MSHSANSFNAQLPEEELMQAVEPKVREQALRRKENDQTLEVVGIKPRIKSGNGLTRRKA